MNLLDTAFIVSREGDRVRMLARKLLDLADRAGEREDPESIEQARQIARTYLETAS